MTDESKFYHGKECTKGHGTLRYKSGRKCVKCNNERAEQWRKANRGRWLESQRGRTPRYRDWKRKNWIKGFLYAAKRRAASKGIPFDLVIDTVPHMPDICPVCHTRLLHSWETEDKKTVHAASPSLDRIIPELGYVAGNVAWLCYRCNSIKRDATADELRAIANWLDHVSNSASRTERASLAALGTKWP